MSNGLRKAAIVPLLLAGGVRPSIAAHVPPPEVATLAPIACSSGEAQPVLPTIPSDRRIGPYRLLRPLGSGGMGTVYLAESSDPPRRVALKVMREDRREPRLAARFEAERRALARVEHDFIARLYQSGVEEGQPWLALEFVDGEPLIEFCDRRRLDVEARLQLFVDVCEAVQHLHERGILHRDVKPANILVCTRGARFVPKIIDLGLARLSEEGDQPEDCVMGTPAYMAPELLTLPLADLDARCDVYSLGLVLRDLLVGLRSPRGDTPGAVLISALDSCSPSAHLQSLGGDASAVAEERATNAAALQRRIRGSLDRIAQCAGAGRREERHESAAALGAEVARDLRRHAARGRLLHGLALATASVVGGAVGGFLAAGVL